jgi:hypothetical protein
MGLKGGMMRQLETFSEGETLNDLHDRGETKPRTKIGTAKSSHKSSDLDYDIFPIEDPSFCVPNMIAVPACGASAAKKVYPKSIALRIQDRPVYIATGRSGVIKGTIIKNPYFIKLAGSEVYQKMWPVELQNAIGEDWLRDSW